MGNAVEDEKDEIIFFLPLREVVVVVVVINTSEKYLREREPEEQLN
jgi:hypothetical protein